jgi:hypothetical protein
MSLFDTDLLYISLYYKTVVEGKNKRIVIYDDEKGENLFKDSENGVEIIETEWKNISWEDNNQIVEYSTEKGEDGISRGINLAKYRDAVIKRCLKKWNLTYKDQPVPVNNETINKLPLSVLTKLFQKFEKMSDYSDNDLGK